MFCPKCGSFNQEGVSFCTNCGANLSAQSFDAAAEPAVQRPSQMMSDAQIQEAKSAMIQGILSIGFAGVPVLPIVLGTLAKNKGKRILAEAEAAGMPRSGMAAAAKKTGTIGMILGIIMIVYWMIVIISAIANF